MSLKVSFTKIHLAWLAATVMKSQQGWEVKLILLMSKKIKTRVGDVDRCGTCVLGLQKKIQAIVIRLIFLDRGGNKNKSTFGHAICRQVWPYNRLQEIQQIQLLQKLTTSQHRFAPHSWKTRKSGEFN